MPRFRDCHYLILNPATNAVSLEIRTYFTTTHCLNTSFKHGSHAADLAGLTKLSLSLPLKMIIESNNLEFIIDKY